MMSPPSYARATASSTSKASPRASKTTKDADVRNPTSSNSPRKYVELPTRNKNTTFNNEKTPTRPSKPTSIAQEKKKGLKRPSLLTSRQKDNLTYKLDLYHIKPRDTSKPCHLATLPSELRTQIYAYVLPPSHFVSSSGAAIAAHKQHIPPALLHVSRAIRIEVAYTYYTSTNFHFSVHNLDFSPVKRWLEHLAPPHRALLLRRRRPRRPRRDNHEDCFSGVEINVLPAIKNMHTFPPKGFLLDAFLDHHWRACQPFGNIYTLHGDSHKLHFILFCRLAEWWQWWGGVTSRGGGATCKYVFHQAPFSNPFGMLDLQDAAVMRRFLRQYSMTVGMPCVDKTWKRNRSRSVVNVMRTEGVRFLDALDEWYQDSWGKGENKEWDAVVEMTKKAMEKW